MKLLDVLTRSCSRLRIFVSYASEDRPLAERISQVLINAGHRVFFDKESLPAANDFNGRIREAIRVSDRFLFLASRPALEPGRYTLTELGLARQRWPSPVGRVFPVIVDPDLPPEAMPVYLSSVQAINVAGNAPAEIAATIERTSGVRGMCRLCLVVVAIAVAGALGFGASHFLVPGPIAVDVAVVPLEYVILRPRARPPDNPAAPDADAGWLSSPVTLTLPIAYSSRDARSAPAQLLSEEVLLHVGTDTDTYSWAYVVEIVSSSIAATTCTEWLCQKGNVKAENLRPGEITATRETMFLPVPGTVRTWGSLMDAILSADGPSTLTIELRSRLVIPDGSRRALVIQRHLCTVDVASTRTRMLAAGFQSGKDPRPATWQPRCSRPR